MLQISAYTKRKEMADAGPCRGEQQAAAVGRITAIVRPVHDFPVRENRRVCWAVAFERERVDCRLIAC